MTYNTLVNCGEPAMSRQRCGKTARPEIMALEARTLLSGTNAAGARSGRPAEIRHLHSSVVHNAAVVIPRLAEYMRPASGLAGATGKFVPVTAGSVGANNNTGTVDNVYVIVHGWMPGYLAWVQSVEKKDKLPLSWETWQPGPNKPKDLGPSTTWLFQGSDTITTDPIFPINPTGMAQEILSVDPHATVLAYSWIDQSATVPISVYPEGYRSEAYTTLNGIRLAKLLTEALAPNYATGLGKVHLIGHSHGAVRDGGRSDLAERGRDESPGRRRAPAHAAGLAGVRQQ